MPIGATQRQLVRTAQLTVDVAESAAATRQVRTTAAAAGGIVVEEQTSERGAWLVLRVPAESLDKVIDDIAAIGSVTARTSQVVDSTAEVVDLDARVASQQASVARVRALLAQATSIGDVVAIESELARREADLDSLTNRLAVLRDQVAMSTLSLDLRAPSTGLIDDDDDRAVGFADGLDAGWRGLLALGTAVAAVIGFVLPFLPVLAVLFALGWAARRLVRARRVVAPTTPAPTPDHDPGRCRGGVTTAPAALAGAERPGLRWGVKVRAAPRHARAIPRSGEAAGSWAHGRRRGVSAVPAGTSEVGPPFRRRTR